MPRISHDQKQFYKAKIRGLLASAYGIRDSDFFKSRLFALHETKWKLAG